MAKRALPAAFATITKIFPPGLRRASRDPQDRQFERKVVFGDYYGALANAGLFSPSRSRPWPIERAVFEGYERIIWVFRSVETIAGQAARLKFVLKQDEDEVDDHPLLELLNTRANPMETGRQFRSRLGKQLLLSKRGVFVEVTRARNGTPLRLDLLPPGRTRPVPGSALAPDNGTGIRPWRLIDHYEIVRADGTRSFLPAESVIWFREPHPTDAYSGVTPLEAAGMSVELDFFARLYNTTFMKNDARPGGIIGVGGDMDDEDIKKLEEKFDRGPAEAGKLTVIAGDVSYVDSVTRPRDAQHGETADRSKIEVLDAFGVPESMLGNASGRTFDNAGQEGYSFWTITMPPFLDLQVTGFDELSEPELEGFFDVSTVPALAAAEAAKREEARAEAAAGLISIDDYRLATGKEPYGMPATRALIIAGGTTMVPTSEDDQKALGGPLVPLGQAAAPAPGQPPAGQDAPAAVSGSTAAALPPARRQSHPEPGHHDTGPAGDNADTAERGQAAAAVKAVPAPWQISPRRPPALPAPVRRPAPARRTITGIQVKAAPRSTPPPSASQPGTGDSQDDADPDRETADQQAAQLEQQLTAVLLTLAAAWAASHLLPDPGRWSQDAQAAVAPLIGAAAWEAAKRAARSAGAAGSPGDGDAAGQDVTGSAAPEVTAARSTSAQVIAMVGTAAAGLAARLAADQVTDIAREAAEWARTVAVQAATATINGAADIAAVISAALRGLTVLRIWRTRRDTRVRPAHRKAEGQRQPPGQPFQVGGWPLRYPGDPMGPPALAYNCRCKVTHRFGRVPAGLPRTRPDGPLPNRCYPPRRSASSLASPRV